MKKLIFMIAIAIFLMSVNNIINAQDTTEYVGKKKPKLNIENLLWKQYIGIKIDLRSGYGLVYDLNIGSTNAMKPINIYFSLLNGFGMDDPSLGFCVSKNLTEKFKIGADFNYFFNFDFKAFLAQGALIENMISAKNWRAQKISAHIIPEFSFPIKSKKTIGEGENKRIVTLIKNEISIYGGFGIFSKRKDRSRQDYILGLRFKHSI
ncbi:MAG: hypothetical protein WCX46_03665, partial [Candidatus Paceibacterota bacterium]